MSKEGQKGRIKTRGFICGQKGHWAGKCPERKYKPRLAALCSNLDPHLWDLCVYSEDTPPPSGEIILFPDDSENEDSEPISDSYVALDMFQIHMFLQGRDC